MTRWLRVLVTLLVLQALPALAEGPQAPREFAPKAGKGRVVVLVSGQTGPTNYTELSGSLAAAGFDVFLVDGNDYWLKGGGGEELLKGVIAQARQSPNALPGKIGVVGCSLGGASALTYATRWPDDVAAVVTHYPATSYVKHPDPFVARIKVPTLVLAGTFDDYKGCCLIETARQLEQASKNGPAPAMLELHEYPGADHGFSTDNAKRRDVVADALKRTVEHLQKYLGPN